MRRFLRHPTDIPIELLQGEAAAPTTQALRDVSHGGLSFRHARPVAVGALVRLRIALTHPPFETQARVIWCLAEGDAWQVGVEFLDPQARFRARMVEQVCHIEQYRREELRQHGRQLSSYDAALEWIEKFAQAFPRGSEF
jgi:hypothetical protein